MNTLTKNRILQKGDEYRQNGAWKPVPKDDFGLQVQFTDYAEVRRPSETPQTLRETPVTAKDAPTEVAKLPVSPTPISPKRAKVKIATPVAAESDKSPVASHSVTGDVSYLPTVVSKKAHSQKHDREIIDSIPYDLPMTDEETAALQRESDREKAVAEAEKHLSPAALENFKRLIATAPEPKPCPTCGSILCGGECSSANIPAHPLIFIPPGEIEKAITKAKKLKGSSSIVKIDFPHPKPGKDIPVWTGRNGTFNGYGLEGMVIDDRVAFSPIGKRGVGNCTIQIPKAIIPDLVDWLQKQF
jgi:hypothetical protein